MNTINHLEILTILLVSLEICSSKFCTYYETENQKYAAPVIKTLLNEYITQCGRECTNMVDCKAFSRSKNGDICLLHSDITPVLEDMSYSTYAPNPVDCRITRMGLEYVGKQAVTKYGTPCQHWESMSPHSHYYAPSDGGSFPDADPVNYCRNPDSYYKGPWCFTTDPDIQWDRCSIPYCCE